MCQVDQRIRSPLSVDRRPACLLEAHALVKANGLGVLFIDIGCHFWMERETVPNKRSADAGAAMGGVNEQRFHVSGFDQHKGQCVVVFVHSEQKRCARKEAAYHFINGQPILGRQKIVGGVNRSAPNLDYTVAVIWAGRPDFYPTHEARPELRPSWFHPEGSFPG